MEEVRDLAKKMYKRSDESFIQQIAEFIKASRRRKSNDEEESDDDDDEEEAD